MSISCPLTDVRRHRTVTSLLRLLSLSSFLGLGFSDFLAISAQCEADEAVTAQSQLQDAKDETERLRKQTDSLLKESQSQRYSYLLSESLREWENGGVATARERLEACPPALRGWEYNTVKRLMFLGSTQLSKDTAALAVDVSPDGTMIASGHPLFRGMKDGLGLQNLRVRRAEDGKLMYSLASHNGNVNDVEFSPDGRIIATGSGDKLVKLWDTATGQFIRTLSGHSGAVMSLDFSPDGTMLVSGGLDGDIRIWEVATGLRLKSWSENGTKLEPIKAVVFSPDGKFIASGGYDSVVRVWDIATAELKVDHRHHSSQITGLAFLSNNEVISTSHDGTVRQWDFQSGEFQALYYEHTQGVSGVIALPNQQNVITCGSDNTIRIWNSSTRLPIRQLLGHVAPVLCVASSPSGEWIVSCSSDGTLLRWELNKSRQPIVCEDDRIARSISSNAIFSPSGEAIIAGLADGKLGIWNAVDGSLKSVSDPIGPSVIHVSIDSKGDRLAVSADDRSLKIVNLSDFHVLMAIENLPVASACHAFCPGQPWLAGGINKQIRIWNCETGEQLAEWEAHGFTVGQLRFSPDGKRLYSSSISGAYGLRVWDTESWTEIESLGRSQTSAFLELDASGKRLLSHASMDGGVTIWNTERLSRTTNFPRHGASTRFAAMNSSENRLATFGSGDGESVRIWNLDSGQELVTLKCKGLGPNDVKGLVFSPTGDRLLVHSYGKMIIWDGSPFDIQSNTQHSEAISQEPSNRQNAIKADVGLAPVPGLSHSDLVPNALHGHLWDVEAMAYSPDGGRLVSGSLDETLRTWDISTGKTLRVYEAYDQVSDVKFSPDGSMMAAALEGNKVKLWAVNGDSTPTILRGHSGEFSGMNIAFRPDGKRLVSGSRDSTMRLWEIPSGKPMLSRTVSEQRSHLRVAFSPDGSRIACLDSRANAISIRDALTGDELDSLRGPAFALGCLAYSSDGTMIATGGQNSTATLWNALTGKEIMTLREHTKPVLGVEFSPNSKRLVTFSSGDETVKIWDVANGRVLYSMQVGRVGSIAIRPDGKQIATAIGKFIRLWDLDLLGVN